MSSGGLISHLVRRDQPEVPGVRKIVVYELLSLDGVAEDPDRFFADWDDASISVAQALLAAGVVDELRLVIAPRIAGRGRRLLDGLPPIQLESIRSNVSPAGYLLADYRVIR
jgi:hypothetical protein